MKIRWSPKKFQKGLVKNTARRQIHRFFSPFQPHHIQKLLDENKDISQYIPKPRLEQLKELAANYKWASDMLSGSDVVELIPDWIRKMAANHPNGQDWLTKQVKVIRSFFIGG